MASTHNVMVVQGNDVVFKFAVTQEQQNRTVPLPLDNMTVSLLLKATQSTPDASATVYTVGSGLSILNSELGQVQAVIPKDQFATAGSRWYRLDVTSVTGSTSTAVLGTISIMAA